VLFCKAAYTIETISNDFKRFWLSLHVKKITIKSNNFLARTISMRTSFAWCQTISNDLREVKNKQSHFRNLCNAGLHGKCTGSECSYRMILHEILKTDAGTYIARKPMQGVLMHGKKLMHGLSNTGENLMHGFLLHELNNARKKHCRSP